MASHGDDDGEVRRPPSAHRPGWLGAIGAALVLAVVAASWLIRVDPARWQPVDDAWAAALGDADGAVDSVADVLARALDSFSSWPGYLLVLAVLGVLAARRRWWHLLAAALVALGGLVTSQLLKAWVDRDRPPGTLVDVHDASFPSGHSTMAACFVVVVGMTLDRRGRRWWWPVGGALLVLMMLSRIHVHAHWLSDTVAGALLGLGVGMLVWWALYPQLDSELRATGARVGKNPRAVDR